MPQTKAAKKHLKQTKKRTARNLVVKKTLKKVITTTEKAIKEGKGDFNDLLKKCQKELGKAAKQGVIDKKTAARKLSRLSKAVKRIAKKS